jgi:hypothetical protein
MNNDTTDEVKQETRALITKLYKRQWSTSKIMSFIKDREIEVRTNQKIL